MKIKVILSPADPDDADASDSTGLTEEAYNRLTDALIRAGFDIEDIESGPDKVTS